MLGLFLSAVLISSNFPAVHVVSVHDGDTFAVDLPDVAAVFGEKISVRVAGIDTAELDDDRPCARKAALEARDAMIDILAAAADVALFDCRRDKYFRLLCRTVLNSGSVDVGSYLITARLAVPYDGGTKAPWRCRH